MPAAFAPDRRGYALDDVCRESGSPQGDPARRCDRPPPHDGDAHQKRNHSFTTSRMPAPPSEMVAELVQYINSGALNKREATALLAGIMLDTKNFVLKDRRAHLRSFGLPEAARRRHRRGQGSCFRIRSTPIRSARSLSRARRCTRTARSPAQLGVPERRIAAAQAADELLSIQNVRAVVRDFPGGQRDEHLPPAASAT